MMNSLSPSCDLLPCCPVDEAISRCRRWNRSDCFGLLNILLRLHWYRVYVIIYLLTAKTSHFIQCANFIPAGGMVLCGGPGSLVDRKAVSSWEHGTWSFMAGTSSGNMFIDSWICCSVLTSFHVPLSPSSINWYQPMAGDALRLGR